MDASRHFVNLLELQERVQFHESRAALGRDVARLQLECRGLDFAVLPCREGEGDSDFAFGRLVGDTHGVVEA
jgi:hypothetical protein